VAVVLPKALCLTFIHGLVSCPVRETRALSVIGLPSYESTPLAGTHPGSRSLSCHVDVLRPTTNRYARDDRHADPPDAATGIPDAAWHEGPNLAALCAGRTRRCTVSRIRAPLLARRPRVSDRVCQTACVRPRVSDRVCQTACVRPRQFRRLSPTSDAHNRSGIGRQLSPRHLGSEHIDSRSNHSIRLELQPPV